MRPEVARDISKSVLKSRLHKLHAFMEKNFGTEMSIKFESEEISITGDYCSKIRVIRLRKIEEKVRPFALREEEAILKAIRLSTT